MNGKLACQCPLIDSGRLNTKKLADFPNRDESFFIYCIHIYLLSSPKYHLQKSCHHKKYGQSMLKICFNMLYSCLLEGNRGLKNKKN